ncbi:crossover junction endodeoxyribonuclease RuvC [Breznakiellaceae bacterium SP9]
MNLSNGGRALRIIGIDPGLAASGWGVVEYVGRRVRYIAHGCIETAADVQPAQRLLSIYTAIIEVLERYAPNEAAIEKLYFARNVTSALPVAQARGVLCMALAQQGLTVREFTPNEIKKAVSGSGSAGKRQIQDMLKIILGLDAIPQPDHAADALSAAVCSAHRLPTG